LLVYVLSIISKVCPDKIVLFEVLSLNYNSDFQAAYRSNF
jgi:hypothetical protein